MQERPVHLSERAQRTADQPISYFMRQAIENPNLISLAAGLVDPASLPSREVEAALRDVLADPGKSQAALQYGTTPGYGPLRDRLLERTTALDGITAKDISMTRDEVVITTGSQQLLYLLTELLLDPGDLVITEAPSYFVYQGTLTSMGVHTLGVPIDANGMNVDALEQQLVRLEKSGALERLRLMYVCDYFQNPSGLSLSIERRIRLLELAKRFSRKHRLLILEDAAYRELRYEGEDTPSIKSLDRENAHVILAQTFSKCCAPGLKTGYGFLPPDLVGPLLRLKGNHDFGSANLMQYVLDRFLATGAFDRHVAELCRVYRAKRDALLNALDREFRKWPQVRWTHPDGGLYVWMTFPEELATGPESDLMRSALSEGVLYVPGQFCYVGSAGEPIPTNEARVSFGVVPLDQIDEAVHRLARATESCLIKEKPLAASSI